MNKRPNIIYIFADQLRSHSLGCYGNHQVDTPNIDRLAKEGVKFSNAISTHPVCGPYRAMLMSGNYPIKNGMLMTDHVLKNPSPYFAEVCKKEGYNTAYIGKWHLDGRGRTTYIPPERRLGFETFKALECTHQYFESQYYDQNNTSAKTWEQYDAIAQTKEACDYILSQQDDPYCLFISWGPPHDPYVAPEKYMTKFENMDIELRSNVDDYATEKMMWDKSETKITDKFKPWREKHRKVLEDKSNKKIIQWHKGYYAAIEALDDCMGEILHSLEKAGTIDNSIIVFTSDHGDNLGSHRQGYKQLPMEESISVPFLCRFPKKFQNNSLSKALLAPQDIMPTLMALAEIDCHPVDGKNMLPEIIEEKNELQDAVLINKCLALSVNWVSNGNGPWCGVRTKKHTYARLTYTNEPWLLYDNEVDPYQLNNLVDDPDYVELRNQLDQRTNELLNESGEPGNPETYAKIIQRERETHNLPDRWNELLPERI